MNRDDEDWISEFSISAKLKAELAVRGGLPAWFHSGDQPGGDWLAELHRAVVMPADWPAELKAAMGLLVPTADALAQASQGKGAIIMAPSTPGRLRLLLGILSQPVVWPASDEPSATMSIDEARLPQAASALARLVGMIEQTGYVELPAPDVAFGGVVTFGVRFLYYHELGHLAWARSGLPQPDWVLQEEQDIVEELAVDQFAFAMLTREVRNHPELQGVILAAAILAIGYIAVKEFAMSEVDGHRSIRESYLRANRIFHWGKLAEQFGTPVDSEHAAKLTWNMLTNLLRRVEQVPSPILSLVVQTAARPREDWARASTEIIKWCAFGAASRVRRVLRAVHDDAARQMEQNSAAGRALKVIDFILEDTRHLEPDLGLACAFE